MLRVPDLSTPSGPCLLGQLKSGTICAKIVEFAFLDKSTHSLAVRLFSEADCVEEMLKLCVGIFSADLDCERLRAWELS